jgi:hypothetical protein
MVHYQYQSCIEACTRCAQACDHCADACLDEDDVKRMIECIRLDRDCAAICWTAASFMSCNSHFVPDMCRVCVEICDACGVECEKYEQEHCQRCAEACRRCAAECRQMAGATV